MSARRTKRLTDDVMLVAIVTEGPKSVFVRTFGPFPNRPSAYSYRTTLIAEAVRDGTFLNTDDAKRRIQFKTTRHFEVS